MIYIVPELTNPCLIQPQVSEGNQGV